NKITQASNLKVIRQENYCVMLEEGKHVMLAVLSTEELRAIRCRMVDFVDEFESFFAELLDRYGTDTKVFLPTRKLVEKHFF
ncbi:MAG: hypothetical protein ACFFD4_39245, partial [Candidatus Odinarchaeota archaeon]